MNKKSRGVATWVEQLRGTIITTDDEQKVKRSSNYERFESRKG
jgi:hypothetical protein